MKAILVDDEPRGLENLRILLADFCPEVNVLATCTDAREGIILIREHRPDLVFLDIEMPHADGFLVLEAIRSVVGHVIFTTAHEQYAIQAIRAAAFDYLLKPVDPDELMRAINRVCINPEPGEIVAEPAERVTENRLKRLEQLLSKPKVNRLAIQSVEGYVMVDYDEIVRLEAESNYTHIYCVKKKYTAARLLRNFEEQLEESGFIRVHSSHIVNIKHILHYQRGDGGYVVMSDHSQVEVSRSRKKELLRTLLGEDE